MVPAIGGSGRFIALEGIDGCGKSTQARILAEATGARLTFEPGSTPLGRRLRKILLGSTSVSMSGRTEALLMSADRAQHVDDVIRPALADGRWVISDRFSASTLAYQGSGRGLQTAGLLRLIDWAADGVWPDVSVLLDVPLEEARRRMAAAAPDRLERLGDSFFERVRDGFLDQASLDPQRWIVVDGAAGIDEVASVIAAGVRDRIGWPEGGLPHDNGP